MDNKLKIISFNVKGLKGPKKRTKVLNWLSKKNIDIVLLQESHYEKKDKQSWKEEWKGDIYSSVGDNRSRGCTILINKNLQYKKISEHKDQEGRWIKLSIEINRIVYDIFNYYGPNQDETRHLEEMLKITDTNNINHTIIGGDFNFVYDLDKDKLGGNRSTNFKCRETMVKWQKENNMLDAWRERNPNQRKYTWVSNTKPRIYCRLDHR
jgi:exonuclease III